MKQHNLYARDFFSDAQLKLTVIERDPQTPFPLHSHDFSELVIVFRGSGTHFTEEHSYEVSAGDVFVIERGFSHGYEAIKELALYNILFDEALLRQLSFDLGSMPGYHAVFTMEPKLRLQHAFKSRLKLTGEQLKNCRQLLTRMSVELQNPALEEGSRSLALAYFIELIVYIARMYSRMRIDDTKEIMQMSDIIAFMETHIHSQITIEELASMASISASTLHRLFLKSLGCSPIEYHIQLKVDHAARLLTHSRLSVTEIAESSGFRDSNYFSRQFRKRMGSSPREYRKKRHLL